MVKKNQNSASIRIGQFLTKLGIGMRMELIIIFLTVQVVPLVLLSVMALQQISSMGEVLREIAVRDSAEALNDSAVENIERISTDTAHKVANFLYDRDKDILYLASLAPSREAYRNFCEAKTGRIMRGGNWALAEDGQSWVNTDDPLPEPIRVVSTNPENNDMGGFHYRNPDRFFYQDIPLYDEITFIDLNGQELVKYVSLNTTKKNYPLHAHLGDVSKKENTYVQSETFFHALAALQPGEIYVSDVIGAYTGSNYIGMYTPDAVSKAAQDRGYDIPYLPEQQAYAGLENPNGKRFEGIVRWATPVVNKAGHITGYVSFALNHDHIMEFVDRITPMLGRYTKLPSAYEGNYAFIWDYKCRSICHPRHHSIVGYDPETGEPQIPWLETSIYEGYISSGMEKWTDYVAGIPEFDDQKREKKPAPALTRAGLVGLDGRYLNNAPQCTGWMDLTREGGSGSFYILWSGIYKLNTVAAIPYYTGQYAPSRENDNSRRGFGFVAVGAGLDDFTRPAKETEERLTSVVQGNERETTTRLAVTTASLIIVVVLIAIWIASNITGNITKLINGISHFRRGERHFRFNAPVKDEFGTLADSFDDMADSIVDSVKNSLAITDMNRKVVYMNETGLNFCKTTLEEVIGTPYADVSIYIADSIYDPILALQEKREAEIYYLAERDSYLRGIANYLYDKDGSAIGYMVETQDMTEMVREQIRVSEQKALLDSVFNNSPDLIWYMNATGEYLTVNPRFASIAGRPPQEFTGKAPEDILPLTICQGFAENDTAAIAASRPLYSEERLLFADGHAETLDTVRTPIYDVQGKLVGLLGFARDVSSRVSMEAELRKTQIELEKAVTDANRANEHKGEFLARMSHEIRTPMNAIIGITSIVQRRLSNAEGGEISAGEISGHMEQIEASSQHLLGLLNDILDISKIEAGKIELGEETVELHRLADTVASIIQPRCSDKNIRFNTKFDEFAPSTFLMDPLRLRQVLINLLGNAVKFTPECGMIEFKMENVERRDGKTLVRFTVKDNGIGIAKEHQGKIFASFEQVGTDISGKYGGTGLGLAISRRIVQLFGGDISLISELGKGSSFSFSIWLKETNVEAPKEVEIGNTVGGYRGRRMLLVDDVDINRVIVASLLEETGLEIDEATDGQIALDTFNSTAPFTYDIILMDVQMPNMNGYQSSSAIRALDRPDAKKVPIVALTANAFKEDIDKAIAFGMNGHVAKPVEEKTLLEALLRFLGPPRNEGK